MTRCEDEMLPLLRRINGLGWLSVTTLEVEDTWLVVKFLRTPRRLSRMPDPRWRRLLCSSPSSSAGLGGAIVVLKRILSVQLCTRFLELESKTASFSTCFSCSAFFDSATDRIVAEDFDEVSLGREVVEGVDEVTELPNGTFAEEMGVVART